MPDSPGLTDIVSALASAGPATVVLALAVWRLDARLQQLGSRLDAMGDTWTGVLREMVTAARTCPAAQAGHRAASGEA